MWIYFIIQLGWTFMDEDGKTPHGYSTWQFNFKSNLSVDMYAQDSIDLLQHAGIQFKNHEEHGIDSLDSAEPNAGRYQVALLSFRL